MAHSVTSGEACRPSPPLGQLHRLGYFLSPRLLQEKNSITDLLRDAAFSIDEAVWAAGDFK